MDSTTQPTLDITSQTPPYTPPRPVSNEDQSPKTLRPPYLSTLLDDEDDNQLQLDPQQLKTATEQCRAYWYGIAAQAISQHCHGIPPASANPRNMLHRVPALRGDLGQTCAVSLGTSSSKVLCARAFSLWRVTDNACHGLLKKTKKVPDLLQIGVQEPIKCTFGSSSFRRWNGTTDEESSMPSYLGILALGWSYILSARLIELQAAGAKMIYTSSEAGGHPTMTEHTGVPTFTIDIGDVDEDAVRWWAAVLAPGQGWKATVSLQPNEEYLSPWSLFRESTPCINIRWRMNRSTVASTLTPPSSEKAFDFLAQFALKHNLGSQLLVALTTAMTFPTHRYHGTIAQLPLPAETKAQQKSIIKDLVKWSTLNEDLPYYMALSCNPEVVISSLCGMFWEADITCNIVSPWLHPILTEISEAECIINNPGLYPELLAVICCFRRPRISTLWLGAVASGLTPTILRRVRRGKPPLDANAMPWTGCPQSFMDLPGSGPYICGESDNRIRRMDVWRLLHLPPVVEDDLSYNNYPFTPWAPPGKSRVQNCALRVVSHSRCRRHCLEYQHWNWELRDGSVVEDYGFNTATFQSSCGQAISGIEPVMTMDCPEKEIDQEASQEASQDIFRWVTVNGEGVPPEVVYQDQWLRAMVDSDEEVTDENIESPIRNEQQIGLEGWLDGIT